MCSSDLAALGEIADLGQRDGDGVGGESHRLGMEVAAGENIPRHAVVLGKHQRIVGDAIRQIGRSSCRERVCQYVSISVVAVSLKKKKIINVILHGSVP